MFDAGKLRHRLKFLSLSNAQDATTGEMVETWTELCTVWGSFEPYSTTEYHAAARTQDKTSARAVIRHRSDIVSEMRLFFRGKTYEIKGPPLPDKDSGYEYLTLMLAEVNDG